MSFHNIPGQVTCETNDNITNNVDTKNNDVEQRTDVISRELLSVMMLSDEKQAKNYVIISWMIVMQLLKIFFKLPRLHLNKDSRYLLYSGNTSQVLDFAY